MIISIYFQELRKLKQEWFLVEELVQAREAGAR